MTAAQAAVIPTQVPLVCLSAAVNASDRRDSASTTAHTPPIAPTHAMITVITLMIGKTMSTRSGYVDAPGEPPGGADDRMSGDRHRRGAPAGAPLRLVMRSGQSAVVLASWLTVAGGSVTVDPVDLATVRRAVVVLPVVAAVVRRLRGAAAAEV